MFSLNLISNDQNKWDIAAMLTFGEIEPPFESSGNNLIISIGKQLLGFKSIPKSKQSSGIV